MVDRNKFKLPNYDPNNLSQLCLSVGFCLMQIQTFELTIENYLAQVHKLDTEMAREEAEKIFEQCGKMTLGQLFKEIEKNEKIPEKLHKRIKKFISERNWLVHKCRKENEAYLYNPNKFPITLSRIDSIAEESSELTKYFDTKSEEYMLRNNIITKEGLDKDTQRILDFWKKA